ncbi:MAG: hypothetical protein MUF42_07795, partial [Cytophagaceae bacterium]|nr:hypothetical protein [Cytophagaceae bacterium]
MAFTNASTTYTPITGGSVLGAGLGVGCDDQFFIDPANLNGATINGGGNNDLGPGFPIGFTFNFNGNAYDRVGINNNGWISLGQSALANPINLGITNALTTQTRPISGAYDLGGGDAIPAVNQARISALGYDLQQQPTGSELRIETIGTAPNRVLVVQWTNYRTYDVSAGATGDLYNFQIRLNENSDVVEIVYGSMSENSTEYPQVGLRGQLNDYQNRFVADNGTMTWATSTNGGTQNTSAALDGTLSILPASGASFRFYPWDLQPIALVSPVSPLCGAVNQTVTAQIRNNGPTTINFATKNLVIGGSVTGPNPQTFANVTLNSGTLASGATLNVTLSTTYNMSVGGVYAFTITSGPDGILTNNMQVYNVTVDSPIANNTITAAQALCGFGDPALLNGSLPTGGNGVYSYQWQSSLDNITFNNIGGATSQNYDPTPIAITTYYRRGVSSGSCASSFSASIQITVDPVLANNTIGSAQTFCGSGDPAQLNGSLPTGGNGIYAYQWQSSSDNSTFTDIGGATAQNYDPSIISATTYYRRGVSSGGCALTYTSSVQITIEPAIANNTISAAQTFCSSGDPANLNGSIPTGGTGLYSFQWQSSPDNSTFTDIPGATFQNYDPTTISATTYYRRGISSGTCAMTYSGSVQITIEPSLANNTISAAQTFCGSGDPTQLNGSLPTGGNGVYSYQWQSSSNNITFTDISGATLQNYDPSTISSTTYYRRGVSSGTCAIVYSASVQITIEPAIANNTISAAQTFCSSGDPAQLSGSLPTGGNGVFAYQWQSSPDNSTFADISGATAQNYDPSTISSTTYYRRGVSSGTCAIVYSASVQITIEPAIANNTISASQTFCGSGDPAQLNGSLPTGGNGVFAYQWQSSPDNITFTDISGATAQNYDPSTISSTTYYRRGVSSGTCAIVYSASVQITIQPSIANNTISADQTFCGSGDPSLLNGSLPTGGNGIYLYQWEASLDNLTYFPIPGANSQNYDPPVIAVSGFVRRSVLSGSCAVSNSNVITLIVNPKPVTPIVASTVQPTCAVPTGTVTITTVVGEEYSIDGGTTWQTTASFAGLAAGTYTIDARLIADNSCMSTLGANVTINAAPTAPTTPVIASTIQPTCAVPTGTVTVTTTAGVEYSIDGGATWQTTASFAG